MLLSIRDLVVDYEDEPVLRGLNLDVAEGEVLALLGPSGSGKTTLLRSIGGLERPVSGDIWLDGRSLLGVPPHRRGVGMMFQSFALFPHLSVIDNVLFGLQMQRAVRATAEARTRELLALVGLAGFEERAVSTLSGGEQQRVALARSLAPGPRLLMLDEPLGSLDAALRDRLTLELRAIFRQVGITALYITHDQKEALAIADRLAVLRDGRVEQVGAPESVYRAPATAFVAAFLGLGNILPRAVLQRWLPDLALSPAADAILVHPEGLVLSGGQHRLPPARVVDCAFLGDVYRLALDIEGTQLTVRAPLREFAQAPVAVDDLVRVGVDADWLHPIQAG
jgi:ABC-type Fe3+/spermidine/putrescine transport system ATPase subunit